MANKRKDPEIAFEQSAGGELRVGGYVHIDEFLSQKPELSEHDKEGFRVFMKTKGMTYHFSFEDFEKELEHFFNRFK